MKMLSLGIPSTLENWIKLSSSVFGPETAPTNFLVNKARLQGVDAEVIADEEQLLYVLMQMFSGEQDQKKVNEDAKN